MSDAKPGYGFLYQGVMQLKEYRLIDFRSRAPNKRDPRLISVVFNKDSRNGKFDFSGADIYHGLDSNPRRVLLA